MNIVPSRPFYDAPRPSQEGIAQAASLLFDSSRPIMLVGDRLSDDDALDQAVELAELMGLPVYQAGTEVAFPTAHGQFHGYFSLRVAAQRAVLQRVDLVLAVGADPFAELFYWGDVILPLGSQAGTHRPQPRPHRTVRADGRRHRRSLRAGPLGADHGREGEVVPR